MSIGDFDRPPGASATAAAATPTGERQALARRATAPAGAENLRAQQLWLALQQRPWRSLSVVGASPSVSALAAANQLAKICWWFTGQPSAVFDMRDLSLRLLDHQLREIVSTVRTAERVFVALRPPEANPTTIPIARATDAAVLCVALGQTNARVAASTLQAIGPQRFLGSIAVPPDGAGEAADGG